MIHTFDAQTGCNICVCGYPEDDLSHGGGWWSCVECGWEWPSRPAAPPIDAECDNCGGDVTYA